MATPIKDTPVLTGKDAKRFWLEMEKSKNKKVKQEELDRMRESFSKFKLIE